MEELDNKEFVATAEPCRNPLVNQYIMHKYQNDGRDKILKVFGADDLLIINHDELYNDTASFANEFYNYTKRIREASSMRYIRSDSELVPKDFLKNHIEASFNVRERFLIPYDYVMITRADKSQFLISECYSSHDLPNNLHKYSIIRYRGAKEPYREDLVYSEGIDMARLLNLDNEYINAIANDLLSENRLNESLDSVNSILNSHNIDETDHGGSYIGYIDSKTLKICKTLEKNELLSFESKVKKEVG